MMSDGCKWWLLCGHQTRWQQQARSAVVQRVSTQCLQNAKFCLQVNGLGGASIRAISKVYPVRNAPHFTHDGSFPAYLKAINHHQHHHQHHLPLIMTKACCTRTLKCASDQVGRQSLSVPLCSPLAFPAWRLL
jgi:hypothetical protein